jgi:hypothetical protein
MKHIRIFEDTDDMLTRYRELHDLGLIGLEDYYKDLKAAGYSTEEYYLKGQPIVDLDVSSIDRFGREWLDRAFREQVQDWVHKKSGARILSVRAEAGPGRLECRLELTSGEVLGFLMVGGFKSNRFTRVEVNGHELGKHGLKAWNLELAQAVRESLSRLSKDWAMVLLVGFRVAVDLVKGDK